MDKELLTSFLSSDSTEEIPRSDIPNEVTLYSGIERDLVLHISMFPYPLSLDDFIWGSAAEKFSGQGPPRHCFHILPTIRLLLAILDGTEQGVVALLTIAGVTAIMFSLEPTLAALVFLPLPFLLVMSFRYAKVSRRNCMPSLAMR